ncbi:MAG: hypothetical protein ABIK89_00885 [Planctomycetota bacterium]
MASKSEGRTRGMAPVVVVLLVVLVVPLVVFSPLVLSMVESVGGHRLSHPNLAPPRLVCYSRRNGIGPSRVEGRSPNDITLK